MNVLLVSTYDSGGAAKACLRLHEGLLRQGISSKLLILFSKNDYSGHPNIAVFSKEFPFKHVMPSILEKVAIKLGKGKKTQNIRWEIENLTPTKLEIFSEPYSKYDFTKHSWYKNADVVNFHWVSGFIDYSILSKIKKPIIWTLHDMNPFTGGCHYSGGCMKYTNSCEYCHYLKTTSYPTYTKTLLNYKKRNINHKTPLSIVAPSRWLTLESQKSTLFKQFNHLTIPNGIDSKIFKPYNKQEARQALSLPLDKKTLLYVSERIENTRKGNIFILDTLESLKNNRDIIICSVGESNSKEQINNLFSFGKIQDENKLAMIYSAADVLLVPSTEDNLPNTALESILCGTPIISFNIGGLPEIISDSNNGYLCENISSLSLLEKINHFLQYGVKFNTNQISMSAINMYDISVSAKRYIALYETTIKAL